MNNNKTWSLQNNLRTENERNSFKPTGKSPKQRSHTLYVFSLILLFFVVSFIMSYFSETTLEACLTDTFCFNSKENLLLYTFYVFFNFVIVILAITIAYIFGKRFADLIKPQK